MKSYIALLLLGFLTFVTCSNFDCEFTGCEGLTRKGQAICDQYGLGRYLGKVSRDGCGWDAERVECCVLNKRPGCKWSGKCYGQDFQHKAVCRSEFGGDYQPSRSQRCSEVFAMFTYECCLPEE